MRNAAVAVVLPFEVGGASESEGVVFLPADGAEGRIINPNFGDSVFFWCAKTPAWEKIEVSWAPWVQLCGIQQEGLEM